ncbi:MAG: glycosyltransferase family 39 protein, partial [Bryocella sp.]
MTRLKAALAICLALCLALFVVRTISWPFVYDAALIRYANFLMQHHFAPYRDILDYNLPGSYFFDWLVVHTLGVSALAWRIYDLLLVAISGVAMYRIARPYSRFAGFYAASLFAFFHARDGIGQSGQRDLLITSLVLVGVALLLAKPRKQGIMQGFLFGLLIGVAATIKPTAVVALPMALLLPHSDLRPKWRLKISAVLGGLMIAPLAALAWLYRMHSLAAFWTTLTEYIPMHAHLGNLGFWPLLTRCITASHGTILALAVLLAFSDPQRELRRIRIFLSAGMAFGLISYLVQAKGYPDHRYPFAAFLFLFAAIEFTHALRSPGYRRILGIMGLLFGTILSVLSMERAVRDHWPAEPVASLTRDLNALGGAALTNDIQCLDTVDGCIETLYDMRLVQRTGFVYDEFLFTSPGAVSSRQAVVREQLRERFLDQLVSRPPRVIVVMPRLFPLGPDHYAKLDRWPDFVRFLDRCYRLQTQRTFAGKQGYDGGYRLYL